MQRAKFALAVFGMLVTTGLTSSPVKAQAVDQIIRNYGNHPQWTRIVNPRVNAPYTVYPQIEFRNGDHVWIKAGGCVQTGGSGRTWKRYVNPSGSNSLNLYHGQIEIPGAINSLTNFSDLISSQESAWSRMFVVQDPANTFPAKYLTLGYTDDDYSDNGYWGHDNGTEDQCRYDYGSYVDIWIERN